VLIAGRDPPPAPRDGGGGVLLKKDTGTGRKERAPKGAKEMSVNPLGRLATHKSIGPPLREATAPESSLQPTRRRRGVGGFPQGQPSEYGKRGLDLT